MSNQDLKSLKIGVTAAGRVEEHESFGWDLIERWYFPVGFDALEVEELVLDHWRNLYSLGPAVTRQLMPQHGFSETVVDAPDLRADTAALVQEFFMDRAAYESPPWDSEPDEFDPWDSEPDEFDPWEINDL